MGPETVTAPEAVADSPPVYDEQAVAAPEPVAQPRTAAVIPALHEEATIGSVVLLARQHVDVVVVVDDGSADATSRTAKMAGARVLRHETNAGKGRAIRTGFDWARQNGIQHLVLLDADGQHDPDEIPVVMGPILRGESDVNLGIRFGEKTEMPGWRKVGKRVLDYSTAIGTGGRVTDSQTGFRAFSRKAIETFRLEEAGFGVESEMLAVAQRHGLRITETPITCAYGTLKGSTQGAVRHAAGVMRSILRIIGERHPLFVLGMPSISFIVTGVLLAAWVIDILRRTGSVAIGTSVLASLFLLAGLTLGMAAMILHVLPGAIAKQIRIQMQSYPNVQAGERPPPT